MTDAAEGLVHSGFLRAGDVTPDKIALIADDRTFTFAELTNRAHRFAAQVEDKQARRVALCLQNSPVVIDTFFGTLKAGACVCLFDPGWPTPLLRRLSNDHRPDIIVASQNVRTQFSDEVAQDAILSSQDIEAAASGAVSLKNLQSRPLPDTPFLLGFTSGSSGPPKGFIRPHRTWTESFRHSAAVFGTIAEERVLAPGPLSHGLSLYAIIEALCNGATALIQSRFDPAVVLAMINRHDVTSLVLVPTMLDVVLEHAAKSTYASVKKIITAGAKLPPSLRQRTKSVFPNADTVEYYGASELSFITVAKGTDNCPLDSVGRPFSGVEIDIRDDNGDAVEPGCVGTVWVKSDMLCTGYVGPTDGSGMRTDGAWATVGDYGHLDQDGYLFLDGREGSAITSAGYTVYPSSIEAVLHGHPSVADVAVVGLPNDRWGEVIAAAVVPKAGETLSEDDLVKQCRNSLEPYACPRQWLFTNELVRTQSGKIDRVALAELFKTSDG
ncbi:MAG: AMP-binding protein [Alphaproteobacteria bacterium]|nr:AMP-binding protein [Alphaproteobacteria bacterium]